jgi:tRNA-2-methylthio-N6-dimethylallyladenosine synthase
MRKVYLENYGCQMVALDNELILGGLQRMGYRRTESERDADVILINTCAVREHAEERVFSRVGLLRAIKRRRPDVVIGLLGCMAQNWQERVFERAPFVDLVVGPRHFGAVPRLVEEVARTRARRVACEEHDAEFLEPHHTPDGRAAPFQAYVKAIEGCDLSCTFCIVPRVRGPEVSRPPDEIVEEVRRLAAEGVVEVTLLGQTINSYGKGLRPRIDLAGLLERVHEVEGIRRIRFITSHPSYVRPRLIEAMRDLPKVCPYLHFPAQSGSNRILAAMRRGYTRERYLALCDALRAEVPRLALASDFIVGFPGETPADFEETLDLVERVRFQNAFVFKYSARPGTAAAEMADDVPEEEKRRRHSMLLEAQQRISREINTTRIGTLEEVLVEGPSKTNPARWTGRTDRHQIVIFPPAEGVAPGMFANVRIEDATAVALYGEVENGRSDS